MSESSEDIIAVGSYVVVKRQDYQKLYKVTVNGNLTLGKHVVDMSEIIGKRYWTTFEMIPAKKGKRMFSLKEAPMAESWNDLLTTLRSGNDNRSITDDGTSQKLSKEEILQLQESGKTGKEIVSSLIENNKSFLDKTEYSQEKYLKKKKRKYCGYITICKTNLSSLHDMYFKFDHNKVASLRMDTLAQLLSYSDVQSEGLYLLYDSGSNGLSTAAMLNRIGANAKGHLINLHPGNVPQTTIIKAMNFPTEQLDRLIDVNIYSFLRLYYQGETAVLTKIQASTKVKQTRTENIKDWVKQESQDKQNLEDIDEVDQSMDTNKNRETNSTDSNTIVLKREFDDSTEVAQLNTNNSTDVIKEDIDNGTETPPSSIGSNKNVLKRKLDDSTDTPPMKKPKWLLETQRAIDLMQDTKARGLAIIAKEHPLNIINALLPFLGISRPFVIFHAYREPLQETYVALKQRQNVINLRLFSNFLRSYQVLPNRTHPDILTSDTGGYLLTGYLVE